MSARLAPRPLCAGLWLALAGSLLLALASGTIELGMGQSLRAVYDSLFADSISQASIIVGQIRLPRALLAAAVGAILAMSGAAMQGLFRNPLADPSLIGVTAGASLGASLAIVSAGSVASSVLGLTLVTVGAFIGGLLAVILVFRLASGPTGTSVATMLLAGIAISALAGAVGNILEFFASNEMLRRISLWHMGGLEGANKERVVLAGVIGLLVCTSLPRFATALNAMLLGESEARYLGIDVDRAKSLLVLIVAVGVGASVALAGTIAFVGLVVPHIMRMLIGPDHRHLLPASALAGAVLLVLADTLARVVIAPTELPVGVVTALVGVPFFISLLRRRGQYGMQ